MLCLTKFLGLFFHLCPYIVTGIFHYFYNQTVLFVSSVQRIGWLLLIDRLCSIWELVDADAFGSL